MTGFDGSGNPDPGIQVLEKSNILEIQLFGKIPVLETPSLDDDEPSR
jgi:hypothetical protein